MAVDTKKEQERDELHRAIWAIADELRGAVDGWDFKNYVLGTMFYRYISENLTSYINEGEIEAGNDGFDYAQMPDEDAEEAREGLVMEKGFFILPSELFCNVRANAQNDENLNETLERVFRHIEESAKGSQSENSFAGLFDDFDVNSNKLGATVAKRNERLVKLLDGIGNMNLGSVKDHDIDAFGDAYEYLMTMYASNAGKSGGEFFTPADVSELLTRLGTVGKITLNKVYDPACGSGSLLLQAVKLLGKDAVTNGFYGQEINITTYNLCRINMFLHDIGFDKFDIECEDTLTNPQHWDDEPFELIVSNPPYSIKWAGDDNPLLINDPRFAPAGVLAPKSKADMAFIMHSLSWLAPNGSAAIVCFPGIMYRGGAEKKIRKYLIDNNFVDCIIQLPSNLFFGTSIATCIMVMKRGKTDAKTMFIDASNECIKVTNNNKLTADNIKRIVDTYANREEVQHFSHLASFEEISGNEYNLSVSTYVEAEEVKEIIDIVSLNMELEKIVATIQDMRDRINSIISEMQVDSEYTGCVEWVTLNEISENCDRKRKPVTKGKRTSGEYPYYGASGIVDYVDDYIFDGDYLLVSEDGANLLARSTPIAFSISGKNWVNNHAHVLKFDSYELRKYVEIYLNSIDLSKYISGGAQPKLNQDNLNKIPIPVPSMDRVRFVVDILDRFDAICNGSTSGLAAEIEARKKQFNYYRDKLYSYKED